MANNRPTLAGANLLKRLMREALEPAALEASPLVATDLERERKAIERQLQRRVKQARCEAERMR